MEPPREIPEEEKYLRDRKERQLKAKEVVFISYLKDIGIERIKGEGRKGKAENEV